MMGKEESTNTESPDRMERCQIIRRENLNLIMTMNTLARLTESHHQGPAKEKQSGHISRHMIATKLK